MAGAGQGKSSQTALLAVTGQDEPLSRDRDRTRVHKRPS